MVIFQVALPFCSYSTEGFLSLTNSISGHVRTVLNLAECWESEHSALSCQALLLLLSGATET